VFCFGTETRKKVLFVLGVSLSVCFECSPIDSALLQTRAVPRNCLQTYLKSTAQASRTMAAHAGKLHDYPSILYAPPQDSGSVADQVDVPVQPADVGGNTTRGDKFNATNAYASRSNDNNKGSASELDNCRRNYARPSKTGASTKCGAHRSPPQVSGVSQSARNNYPLNEMHLCLNRRQLKGLLLCLLNQAALQSSKTGASTKCGAHRSPPQVSGVSHTARNNYPFIEILLFV